MRKSYDNILVYTFELLENPRTNVHVNAAIQGVAFSVSLPGGSGGGRLTGSEGSGALRVRVLRNREGKKASVVCGVRPHEDKKIKNYCVLPL